jgi:hypothetical protein
MNTVNRPARPGSIVTGIGLGIVFVLGIAFTAYMIISSWGGAYWVFDSVVAVVVCSLALLRERQPVRTAIAGLAVVAVAMVVSLVADLPQEPGPITALALSVLVGSAIRTSPPPAVGGIAAGGLMVVAGTWVYGSGGIPALTTLGWVAAVVMGLGLRLFDRGQRLHTEPTSLQRPRR